MTPEMRKAAKREYQKSWRQRQDPKVLSEYRRPGGARWRKMKAQDPEGMRRYQAEARQRHKEKYGKLYKEKRR